MSSTPTLILYLHIKFKAHSYPVTCLVTSSFSLKSANLSSYTAIPQRVTCSRAPPNNRGCVLNSQDSLKMPAPSDLKRKKNFLVSPGKITPEIREKMHRSARSHLVNLTLFQPHPECPYLCKRLFPHSLAGYHALSSYLPPSRFTPSHHVTELVLFPLHTRLQQAQYSLWQIMPSLPSENYSLLNIPPIYIQSRSNLPSFQSREKDLPRTPLLV